MAEQPDRCPVEILLIEDNAGDVVLTREGLAEPGRTNISVARDGESALRRLRREGEFAGAKRPDLILLDLNLPRLCGRDVLAAIKADARLRRIPVIVLTSSQADQDISAAYDLNANCFVCKPLDLNEFVRVVRGIEEFWLTVAQLPRGE